MQLNVIILRDRRVRGGEEGPEVEARGSGGHLVGLVGNTLLNG